MSSKKSTPRKSSPMPVPAAKRAAKTLANTAARRPQGRGR